MLCQTIQVVSDICDVDLEIIEGDENKSKSKDNKFPFIETAKGTIINETEAIIRFIVRMNPSTGLLGSTPFEEAVVAQWISWCQSTWLPLVHPPILQVFGYTKQVDAKKFTEGVKKMKEAAKDLDSALNGKKFIAGDKLTIADLYVGACFATTFQTVFDAGFRKAMPNISAWFE